MILYSYDPEPLYSYALKVSVCFIRLSHFKMSFIALKDYIDIRIEYFCKSISFKGCIKNISVLFDLILMYFLRITSAQVQIIYLPSIFIKYTLNVFFLHKAKLNAYLFQAFNSCSTKNTQLKLLWKENIVTKNVVISEMKKKPF